jgi:hypothetical protein
MKNNTLQNKISETLKKDYKGIWGFELSGDFYLDLRMKESRDRHYITSESGSFLGLYQMGEGALIDTGYYIKPKSSEKWEGKWTGKNGIKSKEDFLNNREVQEIAIREYHKCVWRYIKDCHKYEGSEINGIKLTKAGMTAYAHLVGQERFRKFINSNGKKDKEDGNDVPGSQYLKAFSEHKNVDFTVEGYYNTLSKEDQEKYGKTDVKDKTATLDEEDITDFLNKLLIKENSLCIQDEFSEKLTSLAYQFSEKEKKKLAEQKKKLLDQYQNELDNCFKSLKQQTDAYASKLAADA